MDPVLVLVLILVPILGTFAYAGVRGAPWVPTRRRDVHRFLELARLRSGERFYDLGCGDGRLVIVAARAGAIATGFECSILPYILARIRCALHSASFRAKREISHQGDRGLSARLETTLGSARVHYRDFWNADLSDADVVYCFLMPKVYPKLKEKLERECKKGTRVIFYVWPMAGWAMDAVDVAPGQPKLYRHIMR